MMVLLNLDMKYFNYATDFNNDKCPVRDSKKDLLTQFHMDIAASIQSVTEEIIFSKNIK